MKAVLPMFRVFLVLAVLFWCATLTRPESLVSGAGSSQQKSESPSKKTPAQKTPIVIQYSPPFFRWITAGFWPAVVEVTWIQLLQKAGSKDYPPASVEEAIRFYDLATDLDPYFYELYEQGAVFLGSLAHRPLDEMVLLEKGVRAYHEKVALQPASFQKKFWSHPYTLLIFQAYVAGYELQDWPRAKSAFLAAAEMPGTPAYLLQMRVWLKEAGSERKLAIRILKLLIQHTDDETLKETYQRKLQMISS